MLDRLFLKYLSRKGKKAYWIGQLSLCIIYVFALLGLSGLSFDEAQGALIAGVVVIAVVWGVICLVIWPVSKDNENVLEDGELKNERNG